MASKRPTFPARPMPDAPAVWLSIDPGGTKPSAVAIWDRRRCIGIRCIPRGELVREVSSLAGGAALIVLEDGFAGRANPQATAQLSETRGALEAVGSLRRVAVVRVLPDRWRRVLGLPARRKVGAPTLAAGAATLCRLLPGVPAEATSEDTRAAYLIGEACARAWGWHD